MYAGKYTWFWCTFLHDTVKKRHHLVEMMPFLCFDFLFILPVAKCCSHDLHQPSILLDL